MSVSLLQTQTDTHTKSSSRVFENFLRVNGGSASKGVAVAHDNCNVLNTIFIGKIGKGLVSAHSANAFYLARV